MTCNVYQWVSCVTDMTCNVYQWVNSVTDMTCNVYQCVSCVTGMTCNMSGVMLWTGKVSCVTDMTCNVHQGSCCGHKRSAVCNSLSQSSVLVGKSGGGVVVQV